jgi:hypothetical protein
MLRRIDFTCIEESLLHAISKGAAKVVRIILEHPNYIAGAEAARRRQKDPFFRDEEKSQFPPDVSPLALAAHYNNHEVSVKKSHCIDLIDFIFIFGCTANASALLTHWG